MPKSDTHFELFLRRSPKAAWALADAITERKVALEKAQALLLNWPNGGVKVTKESRNARTGDYDSVVVATFGQCDAPRKKKARDFVPKQTASCIGPTDMFTPEARKTYQEVMPRFLEKNRVLPGELIYRVDLLEKLEANGAELTQAIQRVAISRAGGSDELHSVARQLHELTEQAINLSFKNRKSGEYITFDRSLQDVIKQCRKKKSPKNAFASAISNRLMRATNWSDKLTGLLEIWQEVEELEDEDRVFCNDVLTDFFSEWLDAPGTLNTMLGAEAPPAEMLHRMIAVLEPRPKAGENRDPLEGIPAAQTLARAISLGVLPSARHRIISKVFEQLSSNHRLLPGSLKAEFDLLKNFGDRLVQLLKNSRHGEMYEAFCARSKMLMASDTVENYLEEFDVVDRPTKLLEMNANLVGKDAQEKLIALLRGYISQPQFEVAILGTKKPLIALSALRQTQQQLLQSSLPVQDKLHGAQDIDQLGVRLIGQSQLFKIMVKKTGSPEKSALALFRLAAEALPYGQCARLTGNTAINLLKTEEARKALVRDPDLKYTLKDLSDLALMRSDLTRLVNS